MAQMTGQNGVDGVAQIAFDLLLHQRCRYCQERETLDERQRLYQRQPGLLLTCQRVVTDRRIAVEFGDDLLPHLAERIPVRRHVYLSSCRMRRAGVVGETVTMPENRPCCPHGYPQLWKEAAGERRHRRAMRSFDLGIANQ